MNEMLNTLGKNSEECGSSCEKSFCQMRKMRCFFKVAEALTETGRYSDSS